MQISTRVGVVQVIFFFLSHGPRGLAAMAPVKREAAGETLLTSALSNNTIAQDPEPRQSGALLAAAARS